MAAVTFTVQASKASDLVLGTSPKARDKVQRILRFLTGVASGALKATSVGVATACGSARVTFASASGSIDVTIGGEVVTITATGVNATDAAALAAAINGYGSPLQETVVATASGAVTTVTTIQAGPMGVLVAFGVTGTGATASDAALTGGSSTTYAF